jgi:asparagine synthetase B (glutamine-hydrolysing)
MRERDAGQQLSSAELHSQRKFDLLFPIFVIYFHPSIMCGILFISEVLEITVDHDILKATEDDQTILHPDDFQHPLRCRGPDNQSTHTVRHSHGTQSAPQITTSILQFPHHPLPLSSQSHPTDTSTFTFSGSLLQFRGCSTPSQNPLIDTPTGSTLLFNGQIYSGLHIPPHSSDALSLLNALLLSSSSSSSSTPTIPQTLSSIKGPWSLVFYHPPTNTLWIGRDPFGRRSLLYKASTTASNDNNNDNIDERSPSSSHHSQTIQKLILASSVPFPSSSESHLSPGDLKSTSPSISQGFQELPPGLYRLNIQDNNSNSNVLTRVPWASEMLNTIFTRPPHLISPPIVVGTDDNTHDSSSSDIAMRRVLDALQAAVTIQLKTIDRPAFRNDDDADDYSYPNPLDKTKLSVLPLDKPPAPVMIMFSGGVDSTLIAALTHLALNEIEREEEEREEGRGEAKDTNSTFTTSPSIDNKNPSYNRRPIDLVCVCFDPNKASPDRLSAISALKELQTFAPQRQWRLLMREPTEEEQDALRSRLLHLLAPADTYMDFNIGMALWFAGQGRGKLVELVFEDSDGEEKNDRNMRMGSSSLLSPSSSSHQHQHQPPPGTPEYTCCQHDYESQARVVLVGHGADELFGGYGRHRTRFRAGRWEGLNSEMELDTSRLWVRNLGRDDRLIADHSRETRHPFLDENVVELAIKELGLWDICQLTQPLGVGDKKVLRRVLGEELGLVEAGRRVKRAIQFGSRLARQTNLREFGGTRQANAAKAGAAKMKDVV